MMPDVYAEPETIPAGVGGGWQDVVAIPQPAAGAGVAYSIKGEYITRPVAITFRLVTDANVANRVAHVDFEDGNGGVYAFCSGGADQAAGLTWRYGFYPNAAPTTSSVSPIKRTVPMPDVFLSPGHLLRIVVDNIQVGDQLSQIFLVLDQRYTGKPRDRHRRRHPSE